MTIIFGNPVCHWCGYTHGIGYICHQNKQGRRAMRESWRDMMDSMFAPDLEIQVWADDGGYFHDRVNA